MTAVRRYDASGNRSLADQVVVEEPLEIRIGEKPLSVTMRTPGDDFDLAVGFLLTETIISDVCAIESIRHWGFPNVVRISIRRDVRIDLQRLQRHSYATSCCGIWGKASIDAIRVQARPLGDSIRVGRSPAGASQRCR